MVATHNVTWEQGEDFFINLVYTENGVARDLTGFEIRMDIAPASPNNAPVILTLNSQDLNAENKDGEPLDEPGEHDNEATLDAEGNIKIVISRFVTLPGGIIGNRLPVNNQFVYDLFLRETSTGLQKKLLQGKIAVNRSVTLWN